MKCIKSWEKYCPDHDIIEWNEDNFDVSCCDYVREAYEEKKWAFVSDYCRFYVLYNHGGIYLDTDVELIKGLDGLGSTFVGFEDDRLVNSGLLRGADKGDVICRKMLDSYHASHFRRPDGTLDLLTVCERETDILCSLGMKKNNEYQIIGDTRVYPSYYFNPTDRMTGRVNITADTVSVHHYAASWVDSQSRFRGKVYRFIRRYFGKDTADMIRKTVRNR